MIGILASAIVFSLGKHVQNFHKAKKQLSLKSAGALRGSALPASHRIATGNVHLFTSCHATVY